MSHGGSAPYRPHGNNGQPDTSSFGSILNSNDSNLAGYGNSQISQSSFSGSIDQGGGLPHRYPNPNRGFAESDQQHRQSMSSMDQGVPQHRQSNTSYQPNTHPNNLSSVSSFASNNTLPNPIQSTPLPIFDTLAAQADLEIENQEKARIVSNRMNDDPRLIGLVIYTAQCHQETIRNQQEIIQRLNQLSPSNPLSAVTQSSSTTTSTTSAPTPDWTPPDSLKKFCTQVLLESIGDPDLQAYTDTEGIINMQGNKKTLPHSLVIILQHRITAQDDVWKRENLPNGCLTRFPQSVIKVISAKAKVVRESLHNILLQNAHSKHGSLSNPIPDLDSLFLAMADFPGLSKRTATDEEVIAAGQNNLVKKSRYAYLRMEAVFVQGLTDGKGGYTIWKTIDKQLAQLRLKGPRYTEAFYKFIVDEDKRLFDGTRNLAAIKTQELTKFNMPTDTEIEAIVLNLPEH